QTGPRRVALPGATRIRPGARGADGAGAVGRAARAAPGTTGADPGAAAGRAATDAGLAALLLRRRCRPVRRVRRPHRPWPRDAAAPPPGPRRRPALVSQPAPGRGHGGDPVL